MNISKEGHIMNYLYEKVSYLKGLAEGLGIEESSKEGKLLLRIVEALDDFADAISEVYDEQEELSEYVDFIDEDLAEIEDEVFGELDDEDDDEDFDDYDEDDIDYIEVECPHCHEIIYLDKELLEEETETVCPNCNETIITDVEECDDCDDDNCEC